MTMKMDRIVRCWIGAAFVLGCAAEDEADVGAEAQESLAYELAPVSCTAEADCAAGLACVDGTCRPCAAHGQCQSDVCDQGAATPMGPGACLPEAAVVYVNARAYPDCATGDGSRAHPVCRISDAIPRSFGARYALRVYPGYYSWVNIIGRTLYVFGPGDGSAFVGVEDSGAGARVFDAAWAVIDGLDFDVGVRTGVRCERSTLRLRRGTIRGDTYGITATDCDLGIDRVRASGGRAGLTIAGTGTYRITNSYFGSGDLPAVVFEGSSAGIFQFNTVTGGGEIRPGGIDCGTTPRVIRDSIVTRNFPAAGGAQTLGACLHRRVVVGSGDTRPDAGLIKLDPDLDRDGRLLDTPANAACCIDRGARYVSSLYRDFFGTPRLQGASNDIGAHELVQGEPEPLE